MVEAGSNAHEIGMELKRQPNAIYEKAKRLGLRVIISRKSGKIITTNGFKLPEDLPSVEEALKKLACARSGRSKRLKMLSKSVTF